MLNYLFYKVFSQLRSGKFVHVDSTLYETSIEIASLKTPVFITTAFLTSPCPIMHRICLEILSFFFFLFFYHRRMDDAVPECLSSDGRTRGSLRRSDDDLSPPPSPSSRGELLPCSQLSSAQPPPLRHLGTAHYFSH